MIDAHTLANLGSWFAQIACVVALAACLPWLLRLRAPDASYAFWRAVLALCLVLPWLQGRAAPHAAGDRTASVADSTVLGVSLERAPDVARLDWLAIALWIVAAGAAARLAWIAIGLIRLRRLRTAGHPPGDTADQDELQRILGTRADVRYVAGLRHPVTFGVLRPVVLLPSSLLDRPAEIRRAVLAHELLHVCRRDWAWLLVEEFVRAMLWFHPAMWWLVSRVQLAREEVVDEMAVAITGRRRVYVEALLAFADRVPLAPAPAFAERRHLFRRIVLVSREVSMSSKRIVASCAVMALAVLAGSWYAVGAFPLTSQASGVQVFGTPGPVESRANPVTPENPVPRRIGYVEPVFPPDMPYGKGGNVHVRLTLDASGRVVEARAVGLYRLSGRQLMPVLRRDTAQWDPWMRAAAETVSQWRYDPPFAAPLVFEVMIPFGEAPLPPPPPPPPPPAGYVSKAPGAPPPPPPPPPESARRGGRGGVAGGVPGGVPGGVVGGVAGGSRTGLDTSDNPLRAGSGIRPPTKVKDVRPVYPEIAREARVQGTVIVEARIEPDGTVSDARILRSIPLLDQAALDAVEQWRFRPTLLDGKPVPVIVTLTVNFRLE